MKRPNMPSVRAHTPAMARLVAENVENITPCGAAYPDMWVLLRDLPHSAMRF